jgi:hypothetical protein
MGLTIHYALKARSESSARKLIHELHQTAHDLPFKEIGDVVELSGAACDPDNRDPDDPLRWLLIQSSASVKLNGTHKLGNGRQGESWMTVNPAHLIAFTAWPGEGCEESNMGLCLYPAEVASSRGPVQTKLTGWRWHSFCKTQYASNPECGGVSNFLRCHLTVIAMLDKARALGGLGEVSDEGGFWEQRDLPALVKEIGSWNEMIAAFGGKLKDLVGQNSMGLESAIAEFPNFEQLEAAGQDKLPPEFARLMELITRVAKASAE